MVKLSTKQALISKLMMATLASTMVLSACSNEAEPMADTDTEAGEVASNDTNIESSEMTPVAADDAATTSAAATEEENGEEAEAYYSTVGGAEDEEQVDDTVYVNENNSNLDQTPADGVQ